uniref:Uncharacterized protein n=1 Tax=Leersia perrieri TaxID=77586 RepID=A0A0D9VTG7_9ORYZ
MNGDSPVMTESERRAYRYGQAASPRLRAGLGQQQLGGGGGGMRKSWSNDSLSSYGGGGGGAQACVCAPTTHPGSFRCKHHRHHASNLGGAAPAEADADAKHRHQEQEAAQEVSSTEQDKTT